MQTGFYFDQSRCTGCYACSIACKDNHDIPAGPAKWLRLSYREEGDFPNLYVSHVVSPCYHCSEPVCAYICPNEAICKREADGIVVVDREKCREEKTCGIINAGSINGYVYGEQAAPCQIACPANVQVPAYINMAAKGRFKEALEIVRRNMPLPSVCGKVCVHPCETVCKRQELDDPVAIMAIKGFLADHVAEPVPASLPRLYDKAVAIIGSGPAGLAAANDLLRRGYGVTVFESMPVAGGMLVAGVPEHRLPRPALARDIQYLQDLGVEIRTNSRIDPADGLDDLLQGEYAAVLLALGAHRGQKLHIPGAELDGCLTGTEFMRNTNMGVKDHPGKSVVVIGGGNVALDCARAAIRLGAGAAHIVCLESREDMPGDKDEIEQAAAEGVVFHPSSNVTGIDHGGKVVTGVTLQSIENLVISKDKGISFTPVNSSHRSLPADTVIFAIGQTPETGGLTGETPVGLKNSGIINIDTETMMTGKTGVFAAGDCAQGATSIVEAIASGQKAAFFIDRYLQNTVVRVIPETQIDPALIKVDIPPDKTKEPRVAMPLLPVSERINNFKEVHLGYTPEAAMAEAGRCLNCAGHLCKDACPYSAPQFAIEEKPRMQKCDLCLDRWEEGKKPVCVEACLPRALDAGPIQYLRETYSDNVDARGFEYAATIQPSVVHKAKERAPAETVEK